MIYVISKSTCGSYNVRDIQCNANWDCCPYSDYALIPDNLVDGIVATKGYCDITLSSDGTTVTSFTARTIPDVPKDCCGDNTVLSVNNKKADTNGNVELDATDVCALPVGGGTVNGEFRVGENGVFMWESVSEGGNIRIKPPTGKTSDYWEMDAYDGHLRFHTQKNATDPDGAGGKTALKMYTDGSFSSGNNAKTLSNLGALPTAGGTMTGAINMNGKIIHGLPDVTGKDQPVTLNYLETRYWNTAQLWSNASASSNFGAQKISVDLSKYSAVLILFKHAHEAGFVSEFGIKGQKSFVSRAGFISKDGGYYIATQRGFTVAATGVTFDNGVASQNNTDATNQNWALIPCVIYGLGGLN